MKRPRVFAIYHAAPVTPSAATDQRVIAIARDAVTRTGEVSRLQVRLALAAGLVLVAIFTARWMMPGTGTPDATVTNFGAEEGRARAWLITYQPTLAATGPGSREGLQP